MASLHPRRALLASVVALFAAAPTAADPFVVDQALPVGGGPHLFAVINGCCPFVAQTYTAGMTGRLAGLSVNVVSGFDDVPLRVALRDTYLATWTTGDGTMRSAYYPGGTTFASTVLDSASAPLDRFIRLPGDVPQVAGTRYAIVVDYPDAAPGSHQGGWSGSTDNAYGPGELVFGLSSHRWMEPEPTYDVYFSTFVEPIPEPSTMVLLGGSLAYAGARLRWARRG